METGLERFVQAQENVYNTALAEIKSGKKRSHWIWFVFPQIAGLGMSSNSRLYAIRDRQEALSYLAHPLLGTRLREISQVLLELNENNANRIFGSPDDLKFRSSMTLFAAVSGEGIFNKVLDKYFDGEPDEKTLQLLTGK